MSIEEPTSNLNRFQDKETQEEEEEDGDLRTDDTVLGGEECPSLENDSLLSDDSISQENLNSSDCLLSDDESLIEIELENEPSEVFLPELMPEFSAEQLFRKHGLMDLLAEINEEDNMIEIDIAMGSIKCSTLDITA